MQEEEKKKKEEELSSSRKIGWNPVQTEATRTSGKSTTETTVAGDTSGWNEPAGFDFKAPEKPKFKYDPDAGILSAFRPEEPKPDTEGAEREKKLARVNAFGDFMKNLGAFAGTGYAPVEKRQENKSVLRAFNKLDEIRNIYDAKKEKYNDRMFAVKAQDYAGQKADAEQEYGRRYNEELARANRDYQIAENIRQGKQAAYWENGTKRTTTQNGESAQYKNLDLLNAELEAKRARGSGKNENFDFYVKGVGDIRATKDGQIQIGTRIASELLDLDVFDEKQATAILSALQQPGSSSRLAFQSLFDHAARIPKVMENLKEFYGHGMEIIRPEGGGGKSMSDEGKTDVSGLF